MKTFTHFIASTALLVAIAAPASAAISPNLVRDVQFAAGVNSNVITTVNGDTVTLRGHVEDQAVVRAIERAARKNGAKSVVNGVQWRS